jgi:hypothetical protein
MFEFSKLKNWQILKLKLEEMLFESFEIYELVVEIPIYYSLKLSN